VRAVKLRVRTVFQPFLEFFVKFQLKKSDRLKVLRNEKIVFFNKSKKSHSSEGFLGGNTGNDLIFSKTKNQIDLHQQSFDTCLLLEIIPSKVEFVCIIIVFVCLLML